eukprot:14452948-Ditylum_brightwellii.AAC.1
MESGKSRRSVSVSAKVVKAFKAPMFYSSVFGYLSCKALFIVLRHSVQSDSSGRLCAGQDSVVQAVVLP